MTNVKYKERNKHNTSYSKVTKAVCRHCLEYSTFRIITVDNINRLACTRCLKSCRFNKKLKPIQHGIIKVTHLTREEKIKRTIYRIHRWFTGDHIYGPFGRKRKK